MLDLDMNLQLLMGEPIEVGVVKVHPITLRQIIRGTIEIYYKYINLLCIDRENLVDLKDEYTIFQFIHEGCQIDQNYKSFIFEAFNFFLRENIQLCNTGFALGDGRIINETIYNEIVNIIKLQNCLVNKKEEEKIKPANERARQMLEQMKKNQEELNKAKAKDSLDLCDLISIFAAYSENMNILTVWDLSFYQFNDQFNRLKIMQEYEANLQVLMHCDTSKNKIELKHWMSPGIR